MNTEPMVIIRLDVDDRVCQPGEVLSGEYWFESLDTSQVTAIEASVLWYTEGKGDEDMAIHEFWRRDATDGIPIDPRRPERFSAALPNSPLSYDGQILRLQWCVRVRAFLNRVKDVLGEKVFRLGEVSATRGETS